MSKLIKTRSDLLNFVLETQYVKEVFERDLPRPLAEKDPKAPRLRAMNEDES